MPQTIGHLLLTRLKSHPRPSLLVLLKIWRKTNKNKKVYRIRRETKETSRWKSTNLNKSNRMWPKPMKRIFSNNQFSKIKYLMSLWKKLFSSQSLHSFQELLWALRKLVQVLIFSTIRTISVSKMLIQQGWSTSLSALHKLKKECFHTQMSTWKQS